MLTVNRCGVARSFSGDKKQLSAMVAELQTKYAVGTFFQLGVQQDQKDSSQQIVNTGQGGLTLSGGQRQRLGIARAMVRVLGTPRERTTRPLLRYRNPARWANS